MTGERIRLVLWMRVLAWVGVAVIAGAIIPATAASAQESAPPPERVQAEQQAVTHAMAAAREALQQQQEQLQKALENARTALEQARVTAAQARLQALGQDVGSRIRIPELPRVVIDRQVMRDGDSASIVLAHAEQLGLSDDQIDAIRDARRAYRREQISRDADIQVTRMDLEELVGNEDEADLVAVEKKMRQIADLRVTERMAQLRLRQQVRALLSESQREQLEDILPHRLELPGGAHGAAWFIGPERSFGWFGPGGWSNHDGRLEAFQFRFGGDEGCPCLHRQRSDEDEDSRDDSSPRGSEREHGDQTSRHAGHSSALGVKTF